MDVGNETFFLFYLLSLCSFFGGVFDTTLKNVESEEEPKAEGKEEFLQLSCFIQQEVKYMHTGLRSKVRLGTIKWSTVHILPCFYSILKLSLLTL